jgi:hypothetical protein
MRIDARYSGFSRAVHSTHVRLFSLTATAAT